MTLLDRDDVGGLAPRSTITSSSITATTSSTAPTTKLDCGIHIRITTSPFAMSPKSQLS